MKAMMPAPAPPPLQRKVLLALEIVDPVSRSRIRDGLKISADGLIHRPLLNLSGCFVWLEEGDAWPASIRVDVDGLPYATPPVLKPKRPTAGERPEPARIVLTPTSAYPFPSGVLAISGVLLESLEPEAPPIKNATLRLQWLDNTTEKWNDETQRVSPEADGRFCVFAQHTDDTHRRDGLVIVRIVVSREGHPDRNTGSDYPFLKGSQTGCIRDGQAHRQPVTLAWNNLQAL